MGTHSRHIFSFWVFVAKGLVALTILKNDTLPKRGEGLKISCLTSPTEFIGQLTNTWNYPSRSSATPVCVASFHVCTGNNMNYSFTADNNGAYATIYSLDRLRDSGTWNCTGSDNLGNNSMVIYIYTSPNGVKYVQPIVSEADLGQESIVLICQTDNCTYPPPSIVWFYLTEITSLSSSSPERSLRGRGRMRHGARTRGRRGGRHAVQPENRADQALHIVQTRQPRMREIITNVEPDRLKELFIQMLQFHPSLVFKCFGARIKAVWWFSPISRHKIARLVCVGGKCREMPTDLEKMCCERQHCISLSPDFQVLILDEAVHDLARIYRQDALVLDNKVDLMSTNRHAAYRQFILWQHGRVGSGQRCVVPSCCVWRIRVKYSDAFRQYTGFIPSWLA